MKKYILTSLLFLSTCSLFAQKQTNIWYFGNKVGLDFNQSPPIVLNNAGVSSQEGCAVMSDNNGKLLFYTNGIAVLNREHEIMPNGNFIKGDLSSTDNVVIVPMPDNDSLYYLFTVGSAFQEEPAFSYSIVDMRADGGLGDVTTKNVFVADTVLEKLAAIRHCNKKDFWIVVHKWNTDQYYSYLLTAAGLNPVPVISSTGLFINGVYNNAIGTLKFSSKGNKIAAVHSFVNDEIELMDFDNTTGIISNPITFKPNATPRQISFTGIYGAEFSPDGKLLYVSSNHSIPEPCILYQFDITSNNAATILASKQIISNTTSWFAGDLQLGPDNKIYMAMWNDTSISVIDNPNVYGAGCNFMYNRIRVGQATNVPVQFGLPTFMQSYFDSTSNPYDFDRQGSCLDKTIAFNINRLSGIDSVKWDFGDGQQSQLLQPIHIYGGTGFFDVNLIVYKIDCSGMNDTITRKIWIADSDNFLGADTSSCDALSLEIGVNEVSGLNYLWNTGSSSSKINVTGFGDYWLEVDQNGCKIRDSINISQKPKPMVNLGPDTTICRFKSVALKPDVLNYDSYTWNTGEITPSITVDKAGSYYITVTKNSCEASDTVEVFIGGDCDVYIPSAFTPNKDNLNETFGVIDNVSVQYFSMQIYSKWGELIFSSNDITKKWDGTYKGKNMPNGAYPWMLTYVKRNGRKIYDQGTVLLIR